MSVERLVAGMTGKESQALDRGLLCHSDGNSSGEAIWIPLPELQGEAIVPQGVHHLSSEGITSPHTSLVEESIVLPMKKR